MRPNAAIQEAQLPQPKRRRGRQGSRPRAVPPPPALPPVGLVGRRPPAPGERVSLRGGRPQRQARSSAVPGWKLLWPPTATRRAMEKGEVTPRGARGGGGPAERRRGAGDGSSGRAGSCAGADLLNSPALPAAVGSWQCSAALAGGGAARSSRTGITRGSAAGGAVSLRRAAAPCPRGRVRPRGGRGRGCPGVARCSP